MRISPRIFVKIRKKAPGGTWFVEKTWSRKSRVRVPLIEIPNPSPLYRTPLTYPPPPPGASWEDFPGVHTRGWGYFPPAVVQDPDTISLRVGGGGRGGQPFHRKRKCRRVSGGRLAWALNAGIYQRLWCPWFPWGVGGGGTPFHKIKNSVRISIINNLAVFSTIFPYYLPNFLPLQRS